MFDFEAGGKERAVEELGARAESLDSGITFKADCCLLVAGCPSWVIVSPANILGAKAICAVVTDVVPDALFPEGTA